MTTTVLIPGGGYYQPSQNATVLIPGLGYYQDASLDPSHVRPSYDVTVTGWTPSTGSSCAACIDETAYDDADYITSPAITGGQGPAVVELDQSFAAGNHTVHLRGKYLISAAQVKVTLLNDSNVAQGNTGWQSLTGAFASYNLPVTTTGAATRAKIEVQ